MKTRLYRIIMAIAVMFVALPMMGQDYMNIFFKDGSFRKFYMKNLVEMYISKIDAEGIQHSDYEYQHLKTKDDEYIYSLENVDSITFTRNDEELAQENFVAAMPVVFNELSDCETIDDVESHLSVIENAEGVEAVWCEVNTMYVKIAEGEVYSFYFTPEEDHDISWGEISDLQNQVRALQPKIKNVADGGNRKLKAVIANQQFRDTSRDEYLERHKELKELFESCGIEATIVPNYDDPSDEGPTVDFFYNNSDDPANLHIYDYDIIFLQTHGVYKNLQGFGTNSNGTVNNYGKCHTIATSEEIWSTNAKSKDSEDEPNYEDTFKEFVKWRNKTNYKEISDMYINFGFIREQRVKPVKETKDGKEIVIKKGKYKWVAYPMLTEFFFRDKALGKFHDNSILFNGACESLKGDKEDEPSFSFADELFKRNLGTYLGYTEKNSFGNTVGPGIYQDMLNYNMSLGRMYQGGLPEWAKHETLFNILHSTDFSTENKEKYANGEKEIDDAKLLILEKGYDGHGVLMNEYSKFFLIPTCTKEIDKEKANQEYNQSKTVTVEGITTQLEALEPATTGLNVFEPAKIGFQLFLDAKEWGTSELVQDVEAVLNNYGQCTFQGKFTNLERGNTYSYRAYSYDGMYYNYGNMCSFTIEELSDLVLSAGCFLLNVGESITVQILSGNGSYTVESNSTAVTAELNGNIITITAVQASDDDVTITVTDTVTGQTATIVVTVTGPSLPDLELSANTLSLVVGNSGTVEITSGSGSYTVESKSTAVTAELNGNIITITAVQASDDDVTITVTDTITGQTATIVVTVTSPSLPDLELSTNTLSLVVGNSGTVEITSGSGSYTVESNSTAVTAELNGNIITLTAVQASDSDVTIIVTDTMTGQTATIVVTVTSPSLPDLELSANTLSLVAGNSGTVEITAGSGEYGVTNLNSSIARGTLEGTTVTIDAIAEGEANVVVTDMNTGQQIIIVVTVTAGTIPDPGNHEWVDLGLPSGTLWATCNVGASSPEEYGDYFAWGETEPKEVYNMDTYKYYDGSNCVNIGTDIAGTKYDAATANWGAPWRMPSEAQIQELLDKCSSEWTIQNGVNGRKFTGPNGSSIFFPPAGYRYNGELYYAGYFGIGYNWSSTLYISDQCRVFILNFFLDDAGGGTYERYFGISVRPVR